MAKKSKFLCLPCDCKCCMLVIEKIKWEDGAINYSISVQDSYYNHGVNTVWGRIKRAASALFGKPVYYNEAYLDNEETFQKFVEDMQKLATDDLTEAS